ncbi:MAG: hypothetical protein KR126chlam6_00932 [Candidatus Anoxychlamydiales bacterium]|nr:hypothetical protein [Candidatus Anoxychlamydiales bacterium]
MFGRFMSVPFPSFNKTFEINKVNSNSLTTFKDNVLGGAGLIEDLRGYWKLDETSGDAIDVHGGFNGTLIGTPTYDTGKLNGAYVWKL